ncbi:hypothetical protein TrCOL_g7193 [Triparma columacea]|uniref:Secreted protein n=1 Tax=Triparma columacea TaxID=722753 RepID=A0A9W7FYU2_9STRA|nr:hypothetical protein TrCOL_g7193 [Triparma columacea]
MPSKSMILGVAAATIVVASHIISARSSSSSSPGEVTEATVEASVVVAVFRDLNSEMQMNVQKLVQMIQQIQQSGQQIPEAQIQAWVVGEYEKALVGAQEKIFAKHSVDEDDLSDSVSYYLTSSHPDVTKAVHQFKQLYKSVGGRPPEKHVDLPPGVDLQKFCEILSKYMDSMSECMGDIVGKYRSDNAIDGPLKESDLGEIRSNFSSTADDFSNGMLKKEFGIDQDQFAKLMENFQTSQQVQQLVQMLGAQQNKYFRELGIA